MDKQYLNDEFNRFFDFPTEDKSQVSSVSCKLFAEHIAYPMERELENMKRIEQVCKAKLNGDFGAAEAIKNIENILFSGESAK